MNESPDRSFNLAAFARSMQLQWDDWQATVLEGSENMLLNCHRQAGKSTVVAIKACRQALERPASAIVITSRTQRQSGECFRKVLDALYAVGAKKAIHRVARLHCELKNGSRIVALPGREDTIRGYSAVDLLIIDEAARVPNEVYAAVRPMVAVSGGQIICLSTPFGQRGFFYEEWVGQGPWLRVQVPATACARIDRAFLDDERRALGEAVFAQEYLNSFVAVAGLVYPRFGECRIDAWPEPAGGNVGGIDWGWRNPFAAIWGVYESATDVLWIRGERYARGEPLYKHRAALQPLGCVWAADPAGATEIAEFRAADVKVWPANNDLQAGIAAVTARMETGRLKVLWPACPNLVSEAQLYRYPDKREFHPEPEKPIDEHNHALAALRYLVSQLDRRFLARFRRQAPGPPCPSPARAASPPPAPPGVDVNDPHLWTVVH